MKGAEYWIKEIQKDANIDLFTRVVDILEGETNAAHIDDGSDDFMKRSISVGRKMATANILRKMNGIL